MATNQVFYIVILLANQLRFCSFDICFVLVRRSGKSWTVLSFWVRERVSKDCVWCEPKNTSSAWCFPPLAMTWQEASKNIENLKNYTALFTWLSTGVISVDVGSGSVWIVSYRSVEERIAEKLWWWLYVNLRKRSGDHVQVWTVKQRKEKADLITDNGHVMFSNRYTKFFMLKVNFLPHRRKHTFCFASFHYKRFP